VSEGQKVNECGDANPRNLGKDLVPWFREGLAMQILLRFGLASVFVPAGCVVFGACAPAQDAHAKTTIPETTLQPAHSAPERAASGGARIDGTVPPVAAGAIQKQLFGRHEGKEVELYTLTNRNGLVLKAITYGATVIQLWVPGRDGTLADVVLGFDDLAGYEGGTAFFGATVGRVANRIRGAKFTLDGKEYTLASNDPPHHLHGGPKGWDKLVWSAEALETAEGPTLVFTYVSNDGEERYPGTVTARTTYTLTHQNEFKVVMKSSTDKPTLLNMAHHSYWNLAGHAAGSILEHELELFADHYTPGDPRVPTGTVQTVRNSALDFTQSKLIGRDLPNVGGNPLGYDHNFVVNGDPHTLRPVARLKDPKSGRVLTLEADQPGVQFYSGNFLDGTLQGKGSRYGQYSGLCLETQKFPNSVNVPAWQDEVILRPGERYEHTMVHRFSVE
jgi:aldose 1-epimerase